MSTEKENLFSENLSAEVLDTLTDEQFDSYIETGVLPEGFLPESNVGEDSTNDEKVEDENIDLDKSDKDASNADEEDSHSEDEGDVPNEDEEDKDESEQKAPQFDEDEAFKQIFSKPFKANGTDFVVESKKEAIALMQKGINFEAKNRQIKPYMKMAKSIEANNLSEEDINLLVAIKKGDKEAIKTVIDSHNIDTYDLDKVETTNYKPKDSMLSDKALQLDDYIEQVKRSEYASEVTSFINNLDNESKELIMQDPRTLLGLVEEMESGRFNIIKPLLDKELVFGLNTKPSIVRYVELVQENANKQPEKESKPKTEKKVVKDDTAPKSKESVKPTPKSVKKEVTKPEVQEETLEFLESMSDEDYLKYRAKKK